MLHPQALQKAFNDVPNDVWRDVFRKCGCEHAPMLRRVCKGMQTVVDAMLLPAAVRMCPVYWYKEPAAHATSLQRLGAVARRTTVTTLALLCCEPTVHGLRRVLELCPHLQRLAVASRDSLGPVGTAIIAQGLGHATALAHLQLSRNAIDLEGMRALVPVLAASRGLRHLDLSANSLGDGGVAVLAEVLKLCMKLAHLNLSLNKLQAGAAQTLSLSLHLYTALTELNVAQNHFNNVGAAFLAAALPGCNIESLNISHNRCVCGDVLD